MPELEYIFLRNLTSLIIHFAGIYADNEKLKDLLRSTIGKASAKATKEMYQAVIDSDAGMTVRMLIVISNSQWAWSERILMRALEHP